MSELTYIIFTANTIFVMPYTCMIDVIRVCVKILSSSLLFQFGFFLIYLAYMYIYIYYRHIVNLCTYFSKSSEETPFFPVLSSVLDAGDAVVFETTYWSTATVAIQCGVCKENRVRPRA